MRYCLALYHDTVGQILGLLQVFSCISMPFPHISHVLFPNSMPVSVLCGPECCNVHLISFHKENATDFYNHLIHCIYIITLPF